MGAYQRYPNYVSWLANYLEAIYVEWNSHQSLLASVGPLALTNDKIYGPSNVNGPLRDRYDSQML